MLQQDVGSSNWHSEVEELNLKLKSGILWDDWRVASSAISILWWADQSCFLALGQLNDSLVPSLDDLADTDLELEGSALLN